MPPKKERNSHDNQNQYRSRKIPVTPFNSCVILNNESGESSVASDSSDSSEDGYESEFEFSRSNSQLTFSDKQENDSIYAVRTPRSHHFGIQKLFSRESNETVGFTPSSDVQLLSMDNASFECSARPNMKRKRTPDPDVYNDCISRLQKPRHRKPVNQKPNPKGELDAKPKSKVSLNCDASNSTCDLSTSSEPRHLGIIRNKRHKKPKLSPSKKASGGLKADAELINRRLVETDFEVPLRGRLATYSSDCDNIFKRRDWRYT